METDIRRGGVRITTEPTTFANGSPIREFAFVVAATLRAHDVPIEQFIAELRQRFTQEEQ